MNIMIKSIKFCCSIFDCAKSSFLRPFKYTQYAMHRGKFNGEKHYRMKQKTTTTKSLDTHLRAGIKFQPLTLQDPASRVSEQSSNANINMLKVEKKVLKCFMYMLTHLLRSSNQEASPSRKGLEIYIRRHYKQ